MTLAELKTVLDSTGLPVAYNAFQTEQQLPFICYLETGTDNFGADDKVYQVVKDIAVELYTKIKDEYTEGLVESALEGADIFWNKTETWLSDERCFETIYTFQIGG